MKSRIIRIIAVFVLLASFGGLAAGSTLAGYGPQAVHADGYVLPDYLHAQVYTIISTHLNALGQPRIGAALMIGQTAAGIRGGPVTPADSAWLNKLARNIQDLLVGIPPEFPDVVFGAFGV